MQCSTHIVDCLRKINIQPQASASSEQSYGPASSALECNTNNFFRSLSQSKPQWWKVNFKSKVSIKKYTIRTGTVGSGYVNIYNWTLSVSDDDINWRVAHGPKQSYDQERTYSLFKNLRAKKETSECLRETAKRSQKFVN